MKILVVGSGGREHAIAWKLAQSPKVNKIFLSPGNAGTAYHPLLENAPIQYSSYDANTLAMLADFADKENISFTVVGPEIPLASGIVDVFQNRRLKIFGPTKAATQLESSKAFAKMFMQRHNIPTAPYKCAFTLDEAETYLKKSVFPVVIKMDGLAGGKGVFIPQTLEEATVIIKKIFKSKKINSNKNDISEQPIVIEDFLEGEEASFMVITDGSNILPLATSQDHKRLLDHDEGPNTGGMGAYSPAPIITPIIHSQIIKEIIEPTINGMKEEGIPYKGFLYAGIMLTQDKKIYTLEYNCRLGDPETQVIMPRLEGDFASIIESAINTQLNKKFHISWNPKFALGVVLASDGYPYTRNIGSQIIFNSKIGENFLYQTSSFDDSKPLIFHGATKLKNNKLLTNGGRVLSIVTMGGSINSAQETTYRVLERIHFDKMQYRKDIGYRATTNNKKNN